MYCQKKFQNYSCVCVEGQLKLTVSVIDAHIPLVWFVVQQQISPVEFEHNIDHQYVNYPDNKVFSYIWRTNSLFNIGGQTIT